MRRRERKVRIPTDLIVKQTSDIAVPAEDGNWDLVPQEFTPYVLGNTYPSQNLELMFDVPYGKWNYNEVTHEKVSFSGASKPEPLEFEATAILPVPWNEEVQFDTEFKLKSVVDFSHYDMAELPTLPGPSDTTLKRFANKVLTEAVEQFSEEVSIANFIYELREASSLIVREWAARLLAGKLAESFLSWQFGWKPMLSDIMKLLKVCQSVRKRLEHLRKTYDKPVTHTFTTVQNDDADDIQDSYPDIVFDSWYPDSLRIRESVATEYRVKSQKHICTATVVTKHRLEGLDDALAMAKGLENALGLNNLPKVLWNATPFSWMVEWFINLNRPLAAFDVEPFKGKIVIISCNYSIKTVGQYAVIGGKPNVSESGVQNGRIDVLGVLDRKPIGETKHTRYTRLPGLPAPAWVFLEDNFNPNQFAILLALLVAGRNSR